MKSRLQRLLLAVFALSTLVTVPVALAEGTNSGSENESESTTEIQKRIEKEKTELKVKLTSSESERIKTRCKSAQSIVKSHGSNFNARIGDRTKAYGKLVDRLTALSDKLTARGADVTELQTEITALKTKIETFNTDLAAYKQTLVDLSGVDCAADPTGFRAALLTSRTAHDKLIADATEIKTFVHGTIKTTLQTIKAALEAEDKSTETKEGNN